MKLFLVVLCIFSIFCVWSEELILPMYCSDDLESIPPYDDLSEFYRESKNFNEEKLIQQLREIIHFPLRYLIVEEGVVRNVPSEKFEEFTTNIYGRQLIQHFQGDSQEEYKSVYELRVSFKCDPLENKYGISSLSFERRPEEKSLMNLFQNVFVSSVQQSIY